MVVGIVAAIIAIIAGALYALARRARGRDRPGDRAGRRRGAASTAIARAASQSPFVIHDLEPHKPHELEVRKDGYRTWSTRLVLESGQSLQLPIVTLSPEMMPPSAAAAAARRADRGSAVNQLAAQAARPPTSRLRSRGSGEQPAARARRRARRA